MPTHRIRLGPPWDVTPDGTRHVRRFGRPRTLDAAERVWLVCQLPHDASVTVNGERVGPVADITHLLQPRNELVVQVTATDSRGDVALEIRSGAESSDGQQNPHDRDTLPES